jgi:hypothetical protein
MSYRACAEDEYIQSSKIVPNTFGQGLEVFVACDVGATYVGVRAIPAHLFRNGLKRIPAARDETNLDAVFGQN